MYMMDDSRKYLESDLVLLYYNSMTGSAVSIGPKGLIPYKLVHMAIGPENTNLVEDFEYMYLLPVKCHQILFSSCREKIENVSANQRPGWPSVDWSAWKTQIPFSMQFQRRSQKCEKFTTNRQTDDGFVITKLTIRSSSVSEKKSKMWKVNNRRTDRRRPNLLQKVDNLLHFSNQVSSNSIEGLQRRSPRWTCYTNVCSAIRGQGSHLFLTIGPKHKLRRGCWLLPSCQVWSNSSVAKKKSMKDRQMDETQQVITVVHLSKSFLQSRVIFSNFKINIFCPKDSNCM